MHTTSLFATVAALVLASASTASQLQDYSPPSNSSCVYPNSADTSHASPSLVKFIHGYFTAKSLHDLDAWMNFFDPIQAIYADATLGTLISQPNFTATFQPVVTGWGPDAKSYPLRIIGDINSAVVMFVDTPALFGAEIRAIAALDFKDGKVARQADYWDARRSPVTDLRVPDDQYPSNFGESTIQGIADPAIRDATNRLHASLSAGNSTAAAELFTFDAILEDRSTRTRIEGQSGIERYLHRALPTLPYGVGATVRHVVGSAQGGAYEWNGGPGAAARNGITVLDLDHYGQITRLTTVWDASRTSNATMGALAGLSIEE